ncbi:MAG TPA: cupin domain-containing protein [Luteibacter sp.]|jgi:uncharacterized cupin superfamily protein|uniref:cupin domain-containing protein n=1 Tax=Luteibacter sp. TaxID=1886636 RepID=UPI002F3F3329
MNVLSDRARELAGKLIRNFDEVPKERLVRDPLYDALGARLGTGTAATKLGASIDIVEPGMISCPYHYHYAQEEMFVVLEGEGTLRVADERLPIKAGDVIFVPPGPDYPHQLINTSDLPLKYLSISTKESPEFCVYPDSGKVAALVRQPDGTRLDLVQRLDNGLDYWDGEP